MKVITLVIIILFNCGILYEPVKKDPREIDIFTSIALTNRDYGSKAEVIDNKDGTLNYTYISWHSLAGIYTETRGKTILVRRCLIGQLYRPEQNDCQGTGTKENAWGKSLLQWCPTNDTSCEVNGIADPTKSPAAKACAEDTFLGKKWRLPELNDKFSTEKFVNTITVDYSGLELRYKTYYSWLLNSHSFDKAYTNYYYSNPELEKMKYTSIQCIGEKN